MAGVPYFYAYRLKQSAPQPTPTTKKKRGNAMLLFKEKGRIYWLVGNKYTYISNPTHLSRIKTMMKQAGYDTWEHTDLDQISYIKKIATEAK